MKIAVIVSIYPSLSETFVLNQITGLLDLGHEVDVIAGINPKEKKVQPDFIKYKLEKRSYWLPKNKFWRVVRACFLSIRYSPKYSSLILKSLNFFKYGKEAFSLRAFFCLMAILKNGPYDIIYCHFGENGVVGAILKEIGVPGKLVTSFLGRDLTLSVQKYGIQYYTRLFEQTDLLMPISYYFEDKLKELGASPNKIIVHRIGVEIEKFQFRPRHYDNSKLIKVLTISRLVEKKGLEFSIQALKRVCEKHSNKEIYYQIIGDGPLKQHLQRLIRDLQIDNRVQLLGAMNHEETISIMMESDIFVLSSVTAKNGDQEGTPVSLMEAMANGMPVVSTYHSGIPEIVNNGYSGFLVPERDVNKLAESINYLVEHSEIWPKISKAARDYIEKNHNVKNLNKKLAQLFEKLNKETNFSGEKMNHQAILRGNILETEPSS